MKIKLLIILTVIVFVSNFYSQDIKKQNTKYDLFIAKTGITIKFIDYNLPDLDIKWGGVEARIREIVIGNMVKYFYQISKYKKYGTVTASIEFEDLPLLFETIKKLQKDATIDLKLNPDYLENKYVADDGFQIGYYIKDNDLTWFAKLDEYLSGSTIQIKDINIITNSINIAINKIKSFKK